MKLTASAQHSSQFLGHTFLSHLWFCMDGEARDQPTPVVSMIVEGKVKRDFGMWSIKDLLNYYPRLIFTCWILFFFCFFPLTYLQHPIHVRGP